MSELLTSKSEYERDDSLDALRDLIYGIQDGDLEESPELTEQFAEACAQVAEEHGWSAEKVDNLITTIRLEER